MMWMEMPPRKMVNMGIHFRLSITSEGEGLVLGVGGYGRERNKEEDGNLQPVRRFCLFVRYRRTASEKLPRAVNTTMIEQ